LRGRRLAFGAVALIGTLLLAEGILRVTWFRPDAQRSILSSPRYRAFLAAGMLESVPRDARRYRLRPGASTDVEGVHYAVDGLGFRGPGFPSRKPMGTARILLLGDSFAFGWDVDFENSIGARLEAWLARSDSTAGSAAAVRPHVVNAGVPGYHTGQQADLLRHEGVAVDPDGVILLYYPNDMIDEAFLYDDDMRVLYADALPLPFSWRTRLRASALYALPSRLWTRHLYRSGRLSAGTDAGWTASREVLREVRDLCRARGVPFFLVALPLLSDTNDLAREDHASAEQMSWLATFARDESIPYLSLLELLREEPMELSLSPDFHLNPHGSDRAARRLADELIGTGWWEDVARRARDGGG